jgi:hypothetical protein
MLLGDKRASRTVMAVLVLSLSACGGGSGGFLSTGPKPSGSISAAMQGSGVVMSTNKSAPTPVSGSFAIAVSESGYSDYYTATVVSYTAPTTAACLVPPVTPNNAVLAFKQQASPPLDPTIKISPCATSSDVEGIRIADTAGHSTIVYVERDSISALLSQTLQGTGMPLSTNQSAPTPVSGGFFIQVSEGGYSDYFTATVISYTAATIAACIVPPTSPNTAVLAFTQQASAPLNSTSPVSPCATGSDVEGIQISDTAGHSTTVYVNRSP